MATAKLRLRSDRVSQGKTTVYIQLVYKSKKAYLPTLVKIDPDAWNDKSGKIVGNSAEVKELNNTLQAKLLEVNLIINKARQLGHEPSIDYIRESLKATKADKTETKAVEQPKTLLQVFEEYNKSTSSTNASGTARHYKSTLKRLTAYSLKHNGRLLLDEIDYGFYSNYLNHLLNDLNMSNGTANNQIKRIKVVMKYATERGYTQNTSFRRFKTLKETESDIVYLTKQELNDLLKLDLSDNLKLDKVRDLFVLACTTGLRHSDFSRIKPEHIKKDHLAVYTVKTKVLLRIDLNTYSRKILEKYPEGLPFITQQKFNLYIKELGRLAKIDEQVELVFYRGSQRLNESKAKCELLTSHTGRRTFVTQSLERGMPPEVVMKFTGHRDLKTLMRYVKVSDKVKRAQMKAAWDN